METISKDIFCTRTLFCKTWNIKTFLFRVSSSALNGMCGFSLNKTNIHSKKLKCNVMPWFLVPNGALLNIKLVFALLLLFLFLHYFYLVLKQNNKKKSNFILKISRFILKPLNQTTNHALIPNLSFFPHVLSRQATEAAEEATDEKE